MQVRLQKWLSQLGVASRREAERWLLEGRITVNGKKVEEPGTKVDPETDRIQVDGRSLLPRTPKRVYYLLCKPDGVLTTRNDPRGRPTIYDLPSVKRAGTTLFPVGRLDYHTEGLLLLSNDGELVHRLMHPKWKLPRHYYAYIGQRLAPNVESRLRGGIELEDGPTGPIGLEYLEKKAGPGAWYRVTVREGRNRLVRRLFEAVDQEVRRLIRFGFGEVRLPTDLAPGEMRPLHQEELLHLKQATGLDQV